MAGNYQGEHFVWDDFREELVAIGDTEERDDQIKRRRRNKKNMIDKTKKIYCPHAYLILNFCDIMNSSQKIKFRKYHYRKVTTHEPDVVILQDIKDLVMYLLKTPVSCQFINFFYLPVVDRLLRALILYFQYFTIIWNEIVKKRAAIMKKAPNPLAADSRLQRAEELRILRFVVAREYCEILLGSDHNSKTSLFTSISQSQNEKDLRIFEPFIAIAHRIIWIALQRKHFTIIEMELNRLFKSDAFNAVERKTGNVITKGMSIDEMEILYGPKVPARRKLLMNSPLARQLLNESCDYRVLSLGLINFQSQDPRINYLKNALIADEDELSKLGVKLGILGNSRSNYDVMLVLIEDEKAARRETAEVWERKRSSLTEKIKRSTTTEQEFIAMPAWGSDCEMIEIFPLTSQNTQQHSKYDKYREESKKKWISRELNRQSYSYSDAISIATAATDN